MTFEHEIRIPVRVASTTRVAHRRTRLEIDCELRHSCPPREKSYRDELMALATLIVLDDK